MCVVGGVAAVCVCVCGVCGVYRWCGCMYVHSVPVICVYMWVVSGVCVGQEKIGRLSGLNTQQGPAQPSQGLGRGGAATHHPYPTP